MIKILSDCVIDTDPNLGPIGKWPGLRLKEKRENLPSGSCANVNVCAENVYSSFLLHDAYS